MLEIKGKYTSAKIFAETYEDDLMSFVYDMCNSSVFEGIQVRLEPDCHTGTGCAVGTTYPLGDCLNPSHIGVDIGCTISAHKLSKIINPSDYPNIEHKIKEAIPFGFEINEHVVYDEKRFYRFLNSEYNKARSANPQLVLAIDNIDEKFVTKLCQRVGMDLGIFYKSIGSIGGGNHFISVEGTDNEQFVLIHCGSRNFGNKVARYWMKIAENNKPDKALLKAEIERIKSECTDRHLLKDLIARATEDAKSKNPNGILSGENMRG